MRHAKAWFDVCKAYAEAREHSVKATELHRELYKMDPEIVKLGDMVITMNREATLLRDKGVKFCMNHGASSRKPSTPLYWEGQKYLMRAKELSEKARELGEARSKVAADAALLRNQIDGERLRGEDIRSRARNRFERIIGVGINTETLTEIKCRWISDGCMVTYNETHKYWNSDVETYRFDTPL